MEQEEEAVWILEKVYGVSESCLRDLERGVCSIKGL